MSGTTYLMALYIKRILDFIKFPSREQTPPIKSDRQDSPPLSPPPPPPNLWRLLSKLWARLSQSESLPR